eukprot:GHVP01008252.1.p1 GENE.GHVP01008252.1~~GHVP01008252.1.p1  ORF type:complete len:123 (+),score=17.60 GHVP01008252.1:560-928(+)
MDFLKKLLEEWDVETGSNTMIIEGDESLSSVPCELKGSIKSVELHSSSKRVADNIEKIRKKSIEIPSILNPETSDSFIPILLKFKASNDMKMFELNAKADSKYYVKEFEKVWKISQFLQERL